MPIPPPTVLLTLGAAAVVLIGRFVIREWNRVNADLERVRDEPVTEPDGTKRRTLRRDPAGDVWRP